MSHEMPDDLFKDIEEMKIPNIDSRIQENESEKLWRESCEKDKKIFEMTSKIGNEPVEKRVSEEKRGLQYDECTIIPCPIGKKRMDSMCFECDKHISQKIRNIGSNMPKEPGKIIEPRDEEDNPTTS